MANAPARSRCSTEAVHVRGICSSRLEAEEWRAVVEELHGEGTCWVEEHDVLPATLSGQMDEVKDAFGQLKAAVVKAIRS